MGSQLAIALGLVGFWAFVVWGLVWVVEILRAERASVAGGIAGARASEPPPPEDVLEQRLARGEIGLEEYRERLGVLEGRRRRHRARRRS
jgi:hypothetical protein